MRGAARSGSHDDHLERGHRDAWPNRRVQRARGLGAPGTAAIDSREPLTRANPAARVRADA